jgi:serine/threonine protein kinase
MPTLKGQTLLNQYRVEKLIASTPIGDLYRAVDIRSEKSFALTVLPKNIYEDSEALKDLESQSSKLRGITHPNLIPYLGLYQTSTLAFLLEEWVDGPSLRDVLLGKTLLSVNEALIYIKAICNALEALHKNNFLHLNLAPELIRINKSGEIFLGGIGAAQRVNTTARKMSKYPRLYAAPEQFTAQPLATAADMYALAVLIYQLVTAAWINGAHAPTTKDLIRKAHLELTPPAPISLNSEIPDHFSRMILWALRKNPEDRFKTTTELLSSLALAARISLDAIPRQIVPASAPVTDAILSSWSFLPPPKLISVAQDLPPLQDRLAALDSSRSKKNKSRIGFTPVFIFALLAGFISLFWFVRPVEPQLQVEATSTITFTPFAANYTLLPSLTPSPRPTDVHGGRIVFTCTRGDYNQICMVNRDGSDFAQLTDMEASNYYPIFTPDGSSLLFASNRNGPFDLYLLSFSEKQIIQITQNVGDVVSPDYSPDGRRIIFANRAGANPTAVWMVNADGLNPHLIYQGAGDIVAVAWSPNGERIAYAMSVGVPQEYEIFTMDENGKNHVRLTQGLQGIGGSLDWSPDGSHLLIYAGPYEDKDIFKLDAKTGAYVQLTEGGNNAGASYSPDGKYIVFNTLRNDDQADLYIMRADGTNQIQLTNNPEPDWGAQWTE